MERRSYAAGFKGEAVTLVKRYESIRAQVARKLGPNANSLSWLATLPAASLACGAMFTIGASAAQRVARLKCPASFRARAAGRFPAGKPPALRLSGGEAARGSGPDLR